SPWTPKSFGVPTNPSPKWWAQRRLTTTRASSRPAPRSGSVSHSPSATRGRVERLQESRADLLGLEVDVAAPEQPRLLRRPFGDRQRPRRDAGRRPRELVPAGAVRVAHRGAELVVGDPERLAVLLVEAGRDPVVGAHRLAQDVLL